MWAAIVLPVFVLFFFIEVELEPGWRRGSRLTTYHPHYFAIWLVLFFPFLAISVKRLHDRGKSGWWSILMIVVPVLILFFALPVWHRSEGWTSDAPWTGLTWSPPVLWIGLAALALVLLVWWVIELGTRPGTPGPNRYGPAEYPAIGSAKRAAGE